MCEVSKMLGGYTLELTNVDVPSGFARSVKVTVLRNRLDFILHDHTWIAILNKAKQPKL